MAFLYYLAELLIMTVVSLDTLGFIVKNRKTPDNTNNQDYLRVCFTWIFILAIRSTLCCSCWGFLGGILSVIALGAKVFVSFPMLKGTDKLYNMLFEEKIVQNYFNCVSNMVKQRTSCN